MAMICMIAATVTGALWLFLALRYFSDFDRVIDAVDEKDFLLKSCFFVGLGFLKMVHYNINAHKPTKPLKELVALKGRKEGRFHYQVLIGAQISYILTFTPIVFALTALSMEPMVLLIGFGLTGLMVYYPLRDISLKLKARQDGLLLNLPSVESKLALLVRAGMPLREAWKKTAYSAEGVLYDEMRITIDEMQKGGFSELDAYKNFAQRCNQKDIRKLTSMLLQNFEKGNKELAYFLKDMSNEAWETKKNLVVQKGGVAANELLIPTLLIFGGIVAMVVVPIFSGLGL